MARRPGCTSRACRLGSASATRPPNRPEDHHRQELGRGDEPSATGSLVSCSTSQAWATACIQVPMSEISWPNQNSRKLRWRKARRPCGKSRCAGARDLAHGRRDAAAGQRCGDAGGRGSRLPAHRQLDQVGHGVERHRARCRWPGRSCSASSQSTPNMRRMYSARRASRSGTARAARPRRAGCRRGSPRRASAGSARAPPAARAAGRGARPAGGRTMKAPPRPTMTALPRSAASSMTARVSGPAARGRPWPAAESAGSGGIEASGAPMRERRGDALPDAGQALVVSLGLLLGDARTFGDRGHDLRSRNSASKRRASSCRRARRPSRELREIGDDGHVGDPAGPRSAGGRGLPAAMLRHAARRAPAPASAEASKAACSSARQLDRLDDLLDARRGPAAPARRRTGRRPRTRPSGSAAQGRITLAVVEDRRRPSGTRRRPARRTRCRS